MPLSPYVRVAVLLSCSALALSPAFAETDADISSALPAHSTPQTELNSGLVEETADEIIVTGTRDGYRVIDTTSGTKTRTPVLDVPQSIDVVTEEQLRDQAIRSVSDLVRVLPGISAGQGEGHRDQITLRGNNSTADFFVDGLRDDVQYYRGFYNIDRVEVHKGPNAMVFGRGGGGGIVNRITKGAQVDSTLLQSSASLDSFGSGYVAVDLNLPTGSSAAIRVNGFYEELANHRDAYSGNRLGINPVGAVQFGDGTRIQLGYEYVRDNRVVDRGIPSAFAGTIATPAGPALGYRETFFGSRSANRTRFDGHMLRWRSETPLSDSLTLSTQALFGDYDKSYANAFAVTPINAAANSVGIEAYEDILNRRSIIGQTNLEWRGATGVIDHILLLGAEVTDQQSYAERINGFFPTLANPLNRRTTITLSQNPVIPDPVFPAVNPAAVGGNRQIDGDLVQYSFYVQDQMTISDHWQIVAGLRYDNARNRVSSRFAAATAARTDNLWSPRLGLIYKPAENASIYVSWAKSYLPQSGDQFVSFDPVNSALKPEIFDNYEIGAKWDVRPGLTLTAAVYQLDRGNTRATGPTPGTIVLTGAQRTKGFEATLVGRITPQWQTAIAFAHTLAEITQTTTAAPAGRSIGQVPRNQISVWNRYDITDSYGIGLGLFHQGSQFASISNVTKLPSWTRVDAAFYIDITDTISAQLNVENLFNTQYFPFAHNDNNISTGTPRSARISISAKF